MLKEDLNKLKKARYFHETAIKVNVDVKRGEKGGEKIGSR